MSSIIETSSSRFYFVKDSDVGAHVWDGIPVKRVKNGWAAKKGAKIELVRKAGCRAVDAIGEGEVA